MPNNSQSTSKQPQPLSLGKQTISLALDPALLARVERLSGGDREQAIVAALQFWCQHQEKRQQQHAAQQRHARQERDETGWLI